MDYAVVIHKAEEGGYWAEVPALPGCYTQGETIEETLTNVVEAIELHIEVMCQEGMPLPDSDAVRIESVTVNVPTAA